MGEGISVEPEEVMTRANGEGSVYERKDGRWVAAVRDPATGKRRAAYCRSEAEAKRALRRMATNADRGEVVLGRGATLRTWVEQWLPERAGRRRSCGHASAPSLAARRKCS